MSRALCLVPLMLSGLGLSACAGPVATHSGFAAAGSRGGDVNAAESIAVIESPGSGELGAAASAEIRRALNKRGQSISEDSPTRITVSLSARSSDMAIVADNGAILSAAKQQRLLQNCADQMQRLSLVVEHKDRPPVRAWAEESHCHGEFEASLPALAEQAVAALYRKSGRITLRSGKD